MATPILNATANDFIRAVKAGAYDRAAAALPHLSGGYTEALHRAVADLHTHLRQWDQAAAAIEPLTTVDAKLKRNLFRNLAALKTHRPFVYRAVLDEIDQPSPFCPHDLPDGQRTIARVENGVIKAFSPDPAAQVKAAAEQLKGLTEQGKAVAFLSVHDGHVLRDLSSRPPKLLLDRQQPLYLIEPDIGLLTANLLAHDFTGPLGPIEQPRVGWYVGPAWLDAMRLDVHTERFFVFPQTNVKQSATGREIEARLLPLLEELGRLDAAAADVIAGHYATLTRNDFAAALRGVAGRPARVMLLTTRFSTVLQHSTRDADDAFRRLGCQTLTLIEPSPHHGISRVTMRRALADYKPDLVFQIDHHRFEHGDLFPPGLPFVNWIQDLLPNLMTASAGRQLGPTDFSLTPSLQRWVDDFAYPAGQCLEFRKLTRVPHRPIVRDTDERAVVYVSNWSQTATERVAEVLGTHDGGTREILAEACDRMVRTYARGETLASPGDVRRLLVATITDFGLVAPEEAVRQATSTLFDRLNNLLYRQQGLAWAIEACARQGLRLDLYGDGWDRHPQFAAHARGPVAYGRPLEDLTRRAAVNLILEPFMSVSHQRLLDALAAGGFCLVRDHPTNRTTATWIELLAVAGTAAHDSVSLHDALSTDDRGRFHGVFAACDALDSSPQKIDHAATVVRLQRGGFLPTTGETLPLLDRVAFTSSDGLARQLGRARDAEFRTNVAAAQRRFVEARYGYAGGMGRVLEFVGDRLAGPAAAPAKQAA